MDLKIHSIETKSNEWDGVKLEDLSANKIPYCMD